ncbi:hypothetical protein [Brevibacillus laterosporus]|nr:hypothetical protein [Brevibacillus laterosporus]
MECVLCGGNIFKKWCDIQSLEEDELVARAISDQAKEKTIEVTGFLV